VFKWLGRCVKLGGLVEIGKRTPLQENGAKWNKCAAKNIEEEKRMAGIIIRETKRGLARKEQAKT